MTNLEDRLKLEAQIQAQEARSQRATVREIYQAVTGRTGEPGDWHGAQPVLTLIEERDALRARVANLESRLSELEAQLAQAQQGIGEGITRPHDGPERCPTYYDGCNCTVEALAHNIDRAEKAERRVAELEAELKSIADAKYTTWDDGYNTPQDFVAWVQNRCRFLLKH